MKKEILATVFVAVALLVVFECVTNYSYNQSLTEQTATQSVVVLIDGGELIKEYMSEGYVNSIRGRVEFTDAETGRKIRLVGCSVIILEMDEE